MSRLIVLGFVIMLQSPSLFAQMDLTGDWALLIHEDQPWRGSGPELGEYEGLPINAAARMRASAWNASINTLPEHQCIPLPADDFTDFGNIRIWKEIDPVTQRVIAWHEYTEWQAQERVIWMDGRPHPSPYAPHTWQGFSTGKWERNQLTITTTHLKTAPYERVGTYRSDLGTLTEHWIRHGNYLTIMVIISDPVYLAEPLVRTRQYVLDPDQKMKGYTCTPTAEIANRQEGYVPHYLPGKNPFLLNGNVRYGVPPIALPGGPETMYPDFLAKLRNPNTAAAQPSNFTLVSSPPAARPQPPDFDKVEISALPVQGNVYMLVGAGGNTTVQVDEHSVIVVDTQYAELGAKLVAAIRRITNKPIRYIINTHFHTDHTGGNVAIGKAGDSVPVQFPDVFTSSLAETAAIVAHENVLKKMSAPTGREAPAPFDAWPTETFATNEYRLFNGEGIQIVHIPAAHTDGDSLVFFRRSDVIATGDLFSTVTYPVIDRQNGGSLKGILAGLNEIIKLSIPKNKQEGGTYIIPGEGRICDQADVVEYREMVTIIRDRIADLVAQGKTLQEVLAAQPTLDYDGRYGAPTASWTKEMFIEAVYTELRQAGTK